MTSEQLESFLMQFGFSCDEVTKIGLLEYFSESEQEVREETVEECREKCRERGAELQKVISNPEAMTETDLNYYEGGRDASYGLMISLDQLKTPKEQ